MTTLLQFRDAVIAGIKVPGVLYVDKVRGPLSEEGLKKLSVRAPGVLVGVLGTNSMTRLDVSVYRVNVMMAAFLVTEGQRRLDQGLGIIELMMLTVADSTWGVPHTKLPTEISSEPIYDDRVKDKEDRLHKNAENGLLLQGVTWSQETRINRVAFDQLGARPADASDQEALGRGRSGDVWPDKVVADGGDL